MQNDQTQDDEEDADLYWLVFLGLVGAGVAYSKLKQYLPATTGTNAAPPLYMIPPVTIPPSDGSTQPPTPVPRGPHGPF